MTESEKPLTERPWLFQPGNPGKRRGTQNHIPRGVKEAIKEALEELGGVQYLVKVGQDDPAVFCSLLGKIIPQEIKANISGADEWLEKLAATSARIRASTAQPSDS